MRPESYSDKPLERCCSTCRFSHLVAYKLDLLCFHGDKIEITGTSEYPVTAHHVMLNGNDDVGMMEGDSYDRIWGSRSVDGEAVCDFWEPE
jgi:hypothetical protein